jgi:hypothetical protein
MVKSYEIPIFDAKKNVKSMSTPETPDFWWFFMMLDREWPEVSPGRSSKVLQGQSLQQNLQWVIYWAWAAGGVDMWN